MKRITTPVFALVVFLLTTALIPSGRPEDVGFSADRLQRISQTVNRYIAEKQFSGAVTLVARKGRVVHFEPHGLMDAESKTPMRKDAIFRIASMTKPVTGVAVMMMLEEGKVRLSDPVSRFIPEFKDMQVGSEGALAPAARPLTVRDLLTHTGGIGTSEAAGRVVSSAPLRDATKDTLATYIPRLAALPLEYQPGTAWKYSALSGIDTLGRIVEVASGQTFDQFLKQRVFDPLGMKDTSFYPDEARMPRVPTIYRRTPNGLERQAQPAWLSKTIFAGAAGLWSTAEDYAQFAQMLANGGELNGTRLLGPRTVALMASNHVGDLYEKSTPGGGRRGMGFGLTVEVVVDPVAAGRRQGAGSFGWDGAFGTHFWVDPKEQVVGLFMIQQGVNAPANRDVENAVMQAIVE